MNRHDFKNEKGMKNGDPSVSKQPKHDIFLKKTNIIFI
jgi:hypothetical protein